MSVKHRSYEFHSLTPKSSNQNSVFIGYDFLIGCFPLEYEYNTPHGHYDHRPRPRSGQTKD